MPAFRSKVFVCPDCKKMISYSPDQEGTEIVCPRCGGQVVLTLQTGDTDPSAGDAPQPPPLPAPPRARPGCGRSCLFAGAGGCLVVILLLGLLIFLLGTLPLAVPWPLRQTCRPLVSRGLLPGDAQTPTPLGGTDIEITVTRIRLESPRIYQASIRQTTDTETPLYCVTVTVTNNGKTPVPYRTWRRITSENDRQRAATLRDSKGALHGSVSFGPETWPVGAAQETVIQPGAAVTDTLLFAGGEPVPGDFLLTLPGENLGQSGHLTFRIPSETVH